MGKWISVKDRLPDKEGYYLCSVGAGWLPVRVMKYQPREWRSNENLWKCVSDNSYVYNWFVKAWMPLPEPPKEG